MPRRTNPPPSSGSGRPAPSSVGSDRPSGSGRAPGSIDPPIASSGPVGASDCGRIDCGPPVPGLVPGVAPPGAAPPGPVAGGPVTLVVAVPGMGLACDAGVFCTCGEAAGTGELVAPA